MILVASLFLTGIVASKQVAESTHIVLIYFFLGFMYLFLVYLILPYLKSPIFLVFFGMIAAKLDKNASPLKCWWRLMLLFGKNDTFFNLHKFCFISMAISYSTLVQAQGPSNNPSIFSIFNISCAFICWLIFLIPLVYFLNRWKWL